MFFLLINHFYKFLDNNKSHNHFSTCIIINREIIGDFKKMKNAVRNIHAEKNTRDKYQFPDDKYGIDGKLEVKNIHDSRLIADKYELT